MEPFRDDDHAAMLRAARLEEENARLREELARKPPTPAADGAGRSPVWIKMLVVVLVVCGAGLSLAKSCHRVTPAEVQAKSFVVLRKAKVTTSQGSPPFSEPSCDLRLTGTAQVWPNCRVRLECGSNVVYRNPDAEDCSFENGAPVGFFESDKLTVNLRAGTARLRGVSTSGAYTVNFTLE